MSSFYSESARALQDRFGTTALADRLEQAIVADKLRPEDQEFVAAQDFFFLSTVDEHGFPTVSYKGGGPGVVTVLDESTLAFPSYDGNGMFLSIGNLAATANIGMLFVDFVNPTRLRVQATAEIAEDQDLMARYPGAQLVVVARIVAAFGNCPRYVHRHERVAPSRYVPDSQGEAPIAPWKRIDMLQDVVPEGERPRIEAAGGPITADEYGRILDAEATAPPDQA